MSLNRKQRARFAVSIHEEAWPELPVTSLAEVWPPVMTDHEGAGQVAEEIWEDIAHSLGMRRDKVRQIASDGMQKIRSQLRKEFE